MRPEGRVHRDERQQQRDLRSAQQQHAVPRGELDRRGELAEAGTGTGRLRASSMSQWEALAFESEVPDEQARREYYKGKTAAFRDAQAGGVITANIDPDLLCFLLISLAAYWASLPQVAQMITSASASAADEDARRRASVVEAARRLVCPSVQDSR